MFGWIFRKKQPTYEIFHIDECPEKLCIRILSGPGAGIEYVYLDFSLIMEQEPPILAFRTVPLKNDLGLDLTVQPMLKHIGDILVDVITKK